METVKTRREQYAQSTRQALLDTGLEFFVERGYPAVSAEELVRAAGLTRGALYHHFDGKQGLFEAVFEEQERRAAALIAEAMAAHDDLWQRALTGLDTFLDVCADRDYREIVVLQGPIALGWERWRELDQRHLGGLLVGSVRALLDAGLVKPYPVGLAAAALYGALTELALAAARTDDPAQTRRQAGRLVHGLLQGLRPADAG
ncbi:helix-turn-helix domain-containing protein [Nonomuraea sp. NPDC046570]|uniref:TetR/AcrR family transcriptional regulator n=1 Tax=Nonomuraea sp. NPDC046570 TaxID=3155255 RepID=UPI0033E481AA